MNCRGRFNYFQCLLQCYLNENCDFFPLNDSSQGDNECGKWMWIVNVECGMWLEKKRQETKLINISSSTIEFC